MPGRGLPALLVLCCLVAVPPAGAQVSDLTLDARVTTYADNTEFFNPFRAGETLFGAFAHVFAEARLNERIAVRGGAFGHQRFGSDRGFEQARPVLALVIGGPASRLIIGTLETVRRVDGAGPDRTGPHSLLPPIQRETLAFERPWEAGMQWTIDTSRVTQDAWLHWQRDASSGRREVFDSGITTRLRVRPEMAVRADLHLVHQGGQFPSYDPVADSYSVAAGIESGGAVGRLDRLSVEALALFSRHVPDRERDGLTRNGFGTFVRAAAQLGGWRAHGILWRASGFVKVEGDANYHALRLDGTRFGGLRDYAEAGLTRTFVLAESSWLEASVRSHRVESHYEYSFRVLAVAGLRIPLAKPPPAPSRPAR
jgi:hypothetical protein